MLTRKEIEEGLAQALAAKRERLINRWGNSVEGWALAKDLDELLVCHRSLLEVTHAGDDSGS